MSEPSFLSIQDAERALQQSERRFRLLLEKQTEALQNLNRMNRALASNLETDELLQQVTDFGTELTGAEIGAFFHNVADEKGVAFKLCTLSGKDAELFAHLPRPRVTPLFEPIFNGQGVMRIDDVTEHPRFGHNPPTRGFPPGHPTVTSVLAAPVISRDGHVYGGLFFGHSEPARFDEQAESLLSGLAAQASVALDNAQLYQKLEQELRERKLAEQRLETALLEAKSASNFKSEFLANMSHEIRTPMTAILGYADLLLFQLEDDGARHYVETIKRNGGYLIEIINDILDLSKIEAGKLDLQCEQVRIDQMLGEIRSLMTVRAHEKSLDLKVEFDGPVPDTIQTDPTRLRQILVNLVGNAIKFTDHGEITVRTRLLDQIPPMLEFDIQDTGVGMSHEQQQEIWEPFTQADTSQTRIGTGLGLTICRRLVGMLGGEIRVESTPELGSTFRFTIETGPLTGVALIKPATGIELPSESLSLDASQLDCHVLVVDDHHDIRQLAKLYLEKAGASVHLATTGAEAIAAVRQAQREGHRYDAVLMDIQMPDTDGVVATRTLRSEGFDMPIIALTAAAMEHDRDRCLDAGCSAHLAKPVAARELIDVLRDQVAGRRRRGHDEAASNSQ